MLLLLLLLLRGIITLVLFVLVIRHVIISGTDVDINSSGNYSIFGHFSLPGIITTVCLVILLILAASDVIVVEGKVIDAGDDPISGDFPLPIIILVVLVVVLFIYPGGEDVQLCGGHRSQRRKSVNRQCGGVSAKSWSGVGDADGQWDRKLESGPWIGGGEAGEKVGRVEGI